jgi:hypothetical protein
MLTALRPHTVLTFVFMEQLRALTRWRATTKEVNLGTRQSVDGVVKAEARQ